MSTPNPDPIPTPKPSPVPPPPPIRETPDGFEFFADACPTVEGPDSLWEPYLVPGTLALLDGDPGAGKTYLALDLAARLTSGLPLPDGQPWPAQKRGHHVQYISAEDNIDKTLIPRFEAAGGVRDRLTFFGGLRRRKKCRPASFPADFDRWAEGMRAYPRSLVVFDPISALFSAAISTNNDQSVRSLLGRFAEVAAETNAVLLFLRHLNKYMGVRAIYRGSGSIGIAAAARSVLLAGEHPDDPDRRVLAHAKNNLGPLGPSLGYRLVKGPQGVVVVWEGRTNLTAEDLVRGESSHEGASAQAKKWLKDLFKDGQPIRASLIEAKAAADGINFRTLNAVKLALGVSSELKHTETERYWLWMPPSQAAEAPTDWETLFAK